MPIPDIKAYRNNGPWVMVGVVVACVWAIQAFAPEGGQVGLKGVESRRSKQSKPLIEGPVSEGETEPRTSTLTVASPQATKQASDPAATANEGISPSSFFGFLKSSPEPKRPESPAAVVAKEAPPAVPKVRSAKATLGTGYEGLVARKIGKRIGYTGLLPRWPSENSSILAAIREGERPLGDYHSDGRARHWSWVRAGEGAEALKDVKSAVADFMKVVPADQKSLAEAARAYGEGLVKFESLAEDSGALPFDHGLWMLEELDLQVTALVLATKPGTSVEKVWASVDLSDLTGSRHTLSVKGPLTSRHRARVDLVSADLYRAADRQGKLDYRSPVFVKLRAAVSGEDIRQVTVFQRGKKVKSFQGSEKKPLASIELEKLPAQRTVFTIKDSAGNETSSVIDFGRLNTSFGWKRSSNGTMYFLRSAHKLLAAPSGNTF